MKEHRIPHVKVEELVRENKSLLSLRPASGKTGFEKLISKKDLYVPGLALTGFFE